MSNFGYVDTSNEWDDYFVQVSMEEFYNESKNNDEINLEKEKDSGNILPKAD